MKIELGALPPNPRDLTLSGQDREEGDGTIVIPLFRQLGGARVASLRSSILPQLKPFLTGADHKTRQALKPSRKLSRMCSDKSVKDVLVRTNDGKWKMLSPRKGKIDLGSKWQGARTAGPLPCSFAPGFPKFTPQKARRLPIGGPSTPAPGRIRSWRLSRN